MLMRALLAWVYAVALVMFLQVAIVLLQGRFSPAFFLPKGVSILRTC